MLINNQLSKCIKINSKSIIKWEVMNFRVKHVFSMEVTYETMGDSEIEISNRELAPMAL